MSLPIKSSPSFGVCRTRRSAYPALSIQFLDSSPLAGDASRNRRAGYRPVGDDHAAAGIHVGEQFCGAFFDPAIGGRRGLRPVGEGGEADAATAFEAFEGGRLAGEGFSRLGDRLPGAGGAEDRFGPTADPELGGADDRAFAADDHAADAAGDGVVAVPSGAEQAVDSVPGLAAAAPDLEAGDPAGAPEVVTALGLGGAASDRGLQLRGFRRRGGSRRGGAASTPFLTGAVGARAGQVLAGDAVSVGVEVVGVAGEQVFLGFGLVREIGAVVVGSGGYRLSGGGSWAREGKSKDEDEGYGRGELDCLRLYRAIGRRFGCVAH